MSGQLRMTEKEFGFVHKFIFRSDVDLGWVVTKNLIIKKDGSDVLNISTNMVIVLPNVIEWSVQTGQTEFNGPHEGILLLTGSGRREEVFFDVFSEASKV